MLRVQVCRYAGAGEDSCQRLCGPTFDRVVGLDRCDDCELGSRHTKTALCQYISRWLGHWQRRPVALSQDCVALVLKSVATSQSDSAPTVALSIVVIECRLS
jgi:hypothetical protein